MIVGSVRSSGEAIVTITLRGPRGATSEVPAVIDTGFNDWLTLSSSAIELLELQSGDEVRYALADGSETAALLFKAQVQWHGRWREIRVIPLDGGPLLGMEMLRDSSLYIDVIDGGRVEIRPLP